MGSRVDAGGRMGKRMGLRLRLHGSCSVDPPVPSTPAQARVLLRAFRERGRLCDGQSRRDTSLPALDGNGLTRALCQLEARVQGGRPALGPRVPRRLPATLRPHTGLTQESGHGAKSGDTVFIFFSP